MAKRMLTYKQDFLALVVIEIKDRSGVPRPQCVVCMQLLSNESLKINKLKKHFEKVHPTYANKPLAFWKEKETQAKRMRLDAPSSSATVSLEKTTYASFEVALKVARSLYRWSTGNDRESHRVLCQSQGTKSRRCFNTLLFTSRKLGYTWNTVG